MLAPACSEGVFSLFSGFSLFWGVPAGVGGGGWLGGARLRRAFGLCGVCHGSFRFRFRSRRPALRARCCPPLWPAGVGGAGVLAVVLLLGGAGVFVRAVPVGSGCRVVRRPSGCAAWLARGRPSWLRRFAGFLGGRASGAGLRGQGGAAVRGAGFRGPWPAPSAGVPGGGVCPWLVLRASWRWRVRARCRRRPPRWSALCAARWWLPGVHWSLAVAWARMPPSLAAHWLRPGAASLPRGCRACARSGRAVRARARLPPWPPCRPSRPSAVRCRGGRAVRFPFRSARVWSRALSRWWRRPRRGAWCSSARRLRAARCWPLAARSSAACPCSRFRLGSPVRCCRRSGRVRGRRFQALACGLRRGVGCLQVKEFSSFFLTLL